MYLQVLQNIKCHLVHACSPWKEHNTLVFIPGDPGITEAVCAKLCALLDPGKHNMNFSLTML